MGIGIRNAEFGIRNSHGKEAAETASGGHGRSEERKRGPCKGTTEEKPASIRKAVEDCVSIPVSFSGFTALHLDNCTVKKKIRKEARRRIMEDSCGTDRKGREARGANTERNSWSQEKSDEKIKRIRAQGGCQGAIRR